MSKELKRVRESLGLTLQDVSQKSEVSVSTIRKAENDVPIRYLYASKIVNALNDVGSLQHTVEGLGIATR